MRMVVSLLAVLALAGVANANFVNGGFDLEGWQMSSNVSFTQQDAHDGLLGAKLPAGNAWMSQDIYAQLLPDTEYLFSAWMRINSIAAGSATWGNVYLRAGEWPDLGNNVFAGNGFGPDRNIIGEWQLVEGTWTTPSDLSTLPQQRLYVGVREFGIDADVSVDSLSFAVIPEPATLSVLALGGLALLRRRR